LVSTVEALPKLILLQVVENGCRNLLNLFHSFKMLFLKMILGGRKEVTWSETWWFSWVFQDHDPVSRQKLLDESAVCEGALSWRGIVLLGNIPGLTRSTRYFRRSKTWEI